MKKLSKPIVPISSMVSEYAALRKEQKTIKDRMDYLSSEIKKYSQSNGVKDKNGSFYCQDESFVFGSMCKKFVSFNQAAALEFFKSRGLTKAVKMVESIDESAVEQYVADGSISLEDLESITNTKVSYSVDVRVKEEASTVEETSFGIAASKKPRRGK